MKIRRGCLADKEAVEAVMKEAVGRIQATGSSQWGHIMAGEEGPIIETQLAAGQVYLYEDTVNETKKIVGVFYLYQTPNDWDQQLWQTKQEPGIYYLHRLALANAYVGKGLADKLLQATQALLVKEPGAKEIRLDCIATQATLNNLYLRNGFTLVKQVEQLQAGPIVADFNLYQWTIQR